MKTLGMIGGTSWSSTLEHYRLVNAKVARRLQAAGAEGLVLRANTAYRRAAVDFALA